MSELHFNMYENNSIRRERKYGCSMSKCNIENMGKKFSTGPIKPNEPVKKVCEVKKSFLSNAGKVLQSTPNKTLTPRTVNVGPLIYSDEIDDKCVGDLADLEFTYNTSKYDNYHKDLLDFLPMPAFEIIEDQTPPNTPPPAIRSYSMDNDLTYLDELSTDDFPTYSISYEELGLPDIY